MATGCSRGASCGLPCLSTSTAPGLKAGPRPGSKVGPSLQPAWFGCPGATLAGNWATGENQKSIRLTHWLLLPPLSSLFPSCPSPVSADSLPSRHCLPPQVRAEERGLSPTRPRSLQSGYSQEQEITDAGTEMQFGASRAEKCNSTFRPTQPSQPGLLGSPTIVARL